MRSHQPIGCSLPLAFQKMANGQHGHMRHTCGMSTRSQAINAVRGDHEEHLVVLAYRCSSEMAARRYLNFNQSLAHENNLGNFVDPRHPRIADELRIKC
jgi:hypothetical protein